MLEVQHTCTSTSSSNDRIILLCYGRNYKVYLCYIRIIYYKYYRLLTGQMDTNLKCSVRNSALKAFASITAAVRLKYWHPTFEKLMRMCQTRIYD